MKRACRLLLMLLIAWPAGGAPQLSADNLQRLADETSDNDALLDQQDGLYVLLRNAATWQADDFTTDDASPAPQADYSAIAVNPAAARGKVYLIEGWLAQHDRFPTLENHNRDRLLNTLDRTWGDQVTRWSIVTAMDDPDSTVIVLFCDPNARIAAPTVDSRVRVAARFYKLWTIADAQGNPHRYEVFVGGASEVTEAAGADTSSGGPSRRSIIVGGLVGAALVLFLIRRMSQKRVAGGSLVKQRIEQLRREREHEEDQEAEGEESIDDLPDDPIQALDVLRAKHESDD